MREESLSTPNAGPNDRLEECHGDQEECTADAMEEDWDQDLEDWSEDVLCQRLHELLPGVCSFLSEVDSIHRERFIQMMKLMNNGTFPIENICFLVFEDLIQWYSIPNTCGMRYNDNVRNR